MDARPEPLDIHVAPRTSASIGNLRALVVVLVVAVHSVLAYVSSIGSRPFAFDRPPYSWRTFPIVDTHGFLGFDILCAWGDLYLMALFFFVSGFFVWPSLARNGAARFMERRALRLGPPFIVGILLLMPIANYATYLQTAVHPHIAEYVREWLALPFWPVGPMWFLWVLLAADTAAAVLFRFVPRQRENVVRLSSYASRHPVRFLAALLIASTSAYIPFGFVFGPMSWFQFGPISFQLSFPGLYAVYFFAGVIMGACGLSQRLISPDGPLAGYWKWWSAAAAIFFAAWLGASAKTYIDPASASSAWKLAQAIALPPACFTSCCSVLALTIRFAHLRTSLLESLQSNAFGIYLLHIVFVAWLQFALLALHWPAILKAPIVFSGVLILSWASSEALRRLPVVGSIIGAVRRASVPSGGRPYQLRFAPLSCCPIDGCEARAGQRRGTDHGANRIQ